MSLEPSLDVPAALPLADLGGKLALGDVDAIRLLLKVCASATP